MQRTRLNTLFNQILLRFRQWVFNPWRRLAVIIISLLSGIVFAIAVSSIAGQAAKLDVTISAFLVVMVELISWLYYRFTPKPTPKQQRTREGQPAEVLPNNPSAVMPVDIDAGPVRSRSTLAESLNAFKVGLVYGLFVEAFKLGS